MVGYGFRFIAPFPLLLLAGSGIVQLIFGQCKDNYYMKLCSTLENKLALYPPVKTLETPCGPFWIVCGPERPGLFGLSYPYTVKGYENESTIALGRLGVLLSMYLGTFILDVFCPFSTLIWL